MRSDGRRGEPLEWCEPLRSHYRFGFGVTIRTTALPWPVAHGFPSSKAGSIGAEFRQELALVRWDSYCCQFFSMMVSS